MHACAMNCFLPFQHKVKAMKTPPRNKITINVGTRRQRTMRRVGDGCVDRVGNIDEHSSQIFKSGAAESRLPRGITIK